MSPNEPTPEPGNDPASSTVNSALAAEGEACAKDRRRRKRVIRTVLLLIGPTIVIAGGAYVYFTSGRYAETENAYVEADMVIIAAEVAGPITRVAVKENDRVEPGQVLFVVDDRPYRAAFVRAQAQMRAVGSLLAGMRASYQQKLDEIQLAQTNATYYKHELARQQHLAAQHLGSGEDVDSAKHDYDVAMQQIAIDQAALAQLRAQLGGGPDVPLNEQAGYVAMKAARDSAKLDLDHTIVRAPFAGIASKVPVLGQHVAPGTPVMTVVKDHDVWIRANFKETALTHVCPGQPVKITIDTYPDKVWHGHVDSISQATGAEFSVIPAQNATGNWVKVTQRIPVRIFVPRRADDPALRAGMSATVSIDTGYQRPLPEFLQFGADTGTAKSQGSACQPTAASRETRAHATQYTTQR